jgi:hypothetical protein
VVICELQTEETESRITCRLPEFMECNAKPLKGTIDRTKTPQSIAEVDGHNQKVIHIVSRQNSSKREARSRPPVLDQRRVSGFTASIKDGADDSLDCPHCPTPSHWNADEAVVEQVIRRDRYHETVFPNLLHSDISCADRIVEGKVLRQNFREK